MIGRPSTASSSRRASSSRLCSTVLPKPMPGSTMIRSRAMPARERGATRSRQERRDLGDDVVVARRALHRRGLTPHVHQAAAGAALGDERRQARGGAERRDVVDEARAGVQRGARDLELGGVDRDRGAARRPRRGPRSPGRRARAPRPRDGSAPGRVDSPPTSMIAAPSAVSARPCSTAAAASGWSPPSEKESGVTLRMPMSASGRHLNTRRLAGLDRSSCASRRPGADHGERREPPERPRRKR